MTSPQWQVDHWPGQPDKVGRLLISFDRSAGMDGAGELDSTATIELVVTYLSDVLKADKKLKVADQVDIDWLKGFTKDEPETILPSWHCFQSGFGCIPQTNCSRRKRFWDTYPKVKHTIPATFEKDYGSGDFQEL